MTYPLFGLAGTPAESSSADITVDWPVGHASGDIGLLLVEAPAWWISMADLKGFVPIPQANQVTNNSGVVGGIALFAFWCRATSAAMPSPTISFLSDHVRAVILTFTGCPALGIPFEDVKASFYNSTSTNSFSLPTVASKNIETLYVGVVVNGTPTSTPQASGWANADLTSITEVFDSNSSIADGSGFSVVTGRKATAGAIGATTVTLASATTRVCTMALVLSTVSQPNVAYIKGIGTPAETAVTGTISPAWPAHEAGDLGLLIVETGGWPLTFSNQQGFTQLPHSPQDSPPGGSGGVSSTGLHVFYKVAQSGAEAAPSINFIADHVRALIVTVANADQNNPIDIDAGAATSSSVGSATFPSVTTVTDNALVVGVATASGDNTDSDILNNQSWASADLKWYNRVWEKNSNIGNGSGISVGAGVKEAAGLVAAITVADSAHAASQRSTMSIGIRAGHPNTFFNLDKGHFAADGQPIGILRQLQFVSDKGPFVVTGNAATFGPVFNNYVFQLENGSFLLGGGSMEVHKTVTGWTKQDPADNVWRKTTSL